MYATQADMEVRFGVREVLELTDRDNQGEINALVLNQALEDASAEADAYLAGRYQVPLASAPRFLVGVVCDIARYRLCGAAANTTDDISERFRNAVDFLRLAANGKVQLGVLPTGGEVVVDNTVQMSGGGRVFGRDGASW